MFYSGVNILQVCASLCTPVTCLTLDLCARGSLSHFMYDSVKSSSVTKGPYSTQILYILLREQPILFEKMGTFALQQLSLVYNLILFFSLIKLSPTFVSRLGVLNMFVRMFELHLFKPQKLFCVPFITHLFFNKRLS